MSKCSFEKNWQSKKRKLFLTGCMIFCTTVTAVTTVFFTFSVLLERAFWHIWQPMWCSQGSILRFLRCFWRGCAIVSLTQKGAWFLFCGEVAWFFFVWFILIWTHMGLSYCCGKWRFKFLKVSCLPSGSTQWKTVWDTLVFQHYWKRANDSTKMIQQDLRLYKKNTIKTMYSNENSIII